MPLFPFPLKYLHEFEHEFKTRKSATRLSDNGLARIKITARGLSIHWHALPMTPFNFQAN
jgi:hypothetical protein